MARMACVLSGDAFVNRARAALPAFRDARRKIVDDMAGDCGISLLPVGVGLACSCSVSFNGHFLTLTQMLSRLRGTELEEVMMSTTLVARHSPAIWSASHWLRLKVGRAVRLHFVVLGARKSSATRDEQHPQPPLATPNSQRYSLNHFHTTMAPTAEEIQRRRVCFNHVFVCSKSL